jgi:hypothetical protein
MSDVPPPVPPKPLAKNPLPAPTKPRQSKEDIVPSKKRQARQWPPQPAAHASSSALTLTSRQSELADTSDWRYSKGLDAKWSPYDDFIVIERRQRVPEASPMQRQRSQSTSAVERPLPTVPIPHSHTPSHSAVKIPGRNEFPTAHCHSGSRSRSRLDVTRMPEPSLARQPAQIHPRSHFDLGPFAWEAPFPRSKLSQSSPNLAGHSLASIYGPRSGSGEDTRRPARR